MCLEENGRDRIDHHCAVFLVLSLQKSISQQLTTQSERSLHILYLYMEANFGDYLILLSQQTGRE